MAPDELSLTEARRIALASQGFDRPRPRRRPDVSHVRNIIHRLALVQIDYVNVVTPAHYQVLFSRLGPYDTALLDDLLFRKREFTEHWAHEASIIPMQTWPLLRHRRESHRVRPYGFETMMERLPAYLEFVLEEVRTRGPLTAEELPGPEGAARRMAGAWQSVPRAVLEAHFGRGVLAIAGRRPNFARAYDLAERIVPAEHHGNVVATEESQRRLLAQAARALGVSTAGDLADYFRMRGVPVRTRLAELVESGQLRPVRVEGWREPAYLHPDTCLPDQVEARALISPFDPLIWHRPRTARLFGFDYRFEIFVPQEKRRWGTYVLPFLLGERLVARVDLKADRAVRKLRVVAAYGEPDIDVSEVTESLAGELHTLAGWLGLESVTVGRRGGLARKLALALRDR
jgi:uncharacterized protein YcaQ